MARYLIQYQQGNFSGQREIEADNDNEAIQKMWEELKYTIPPMPGVIRAEEILEVQYDE